MWVGDIVKERKTSNLKTFYTFSNKTLAQRKFQKNKKSVVYSL